VGVGQEPLQTRVLLLELLQAPRLFNLHAAVLLAPAVVGLLGHAKLTGDLSGRQPLGERDLSLAELVDDLLCGVPLAGYVYLLGWGPILALDLDRFEGGRSLKPAPIRAQHGALSKLWESAPLAPGAIRLDTYEVFGGLLRSSAALIINSPQSPA